MAFLATVFAKKTKSPVAGSFWFVLFVIFFGMGIYFLFLFFKNNVADIKLVAVFQDNGPAVIKTRFHFYLAVFERNAVYAKNEVGSGNRYFGGDACFASMSSRGSYKGVLIHYYSPL
jgi:hypothetical protein